MKDENLLTFCGYYNRYCYYLGEGYTGKAAWEKVQTDFVEQTGVEKVEVKGFDSPENWRVFMSRKLKKK